jgi:phosphoglycolate phosphatase
VSAPPAVPPLVLLDLDGTLSDSAPGITASVRVAFEQLGLPEPGPDVLRSFAGPPLPVSFRAHGVAEDRVDEAIAAYRGAYEDGGMWQSPLFPGIEEQLRRLRAAGCTLAVATSKPEVYARPVAVHWGLDALVDGVYGAPLDHVPSTKATVIAHALASLGPDRVPGVAATLMVGDRHHDVDGAAEHGFRCLGVGWGYAGPGELDDAVGVVPTVDRLADAVLAELSVDPVPAT